MADTRLRTPFLIWALGLFAAAFAIEAMSGTLVDLLAPVTSLAAPGVGSPPGRGVPAIALVDGLLLMSMALLAAPLLIPASLHAKGQGVVTLVVSVLTAFAGIASAFMALAKALLMVGVLLAFPFGTIVYLIKWGHFDRSGAAAVLAAVWTLKLTAAVLLVLAHQRFLAMKGLLLLVATSLAMGLVVSFLHALPPRFLASITDAVAAIVVAVVAVVWGIILAVLAVPPVVKALRVDR